MYVETVPNRSSPPAVLLRESYRESGKVKKRTLANLTDWPTEKVEALRRVLRGDTLVSADDAFEIIRSLPHGHVAAVLGTARKIGLERDIATRRCAERDRVMAMIVSRVISPGSKLAMTREIAKETASADLAEVLELGSVEVGDFYEAMDWLLERQAQIEKKLAARHLADATLVLYDVTSSYFEGRCCPLGRLGHSRDGKKGKLQIVFGLLCTIEGCPVAVEVFEGNTADPKTVSSQLQKIQHRFGLKRIVIVGDRGMLTQARLREDLEPLGFGWITALRAPAIKGLLARGLIDRSLFDEQDLAEIASPDYPGERLLVCRNPLLATERARKREDLLQATERELERVAQATRRPNRPLRGADAIGVRVGKVINKYKVGKHFRTDIADESFAYQRDQENIEREAAMDGIYIIRTTVPAEELDAEQVVRTYKQLADVERAFRCMKTVDLEVRPIHHRLPDRVRAHVLLCMLSYYVEWHMRKALAPILFDDHDPEGAEAARESIVAPAQRSPSAEAKAHSKTTAEGMPVHSFRTLIKDLGTLARNTVSFKTADAPTCTKLTSPTPVQQKAFDLLGLTPSL